MSIIETPCSQAMTCSADEVGTFEHDEFHPDTTPHVEDWFRDPGSGRKTPDGRRRRRAKQACWADCPMRMRLICLDAALSQGPDMQHGIWGGYEEAERVAILQERGRRDRVRHEAAIARGDAHSLECLQVASIAGMTTAAVHEVGGVESCHVNYQPPMV